MKHRIKQKIRERINQIRPIGILLAVFAILIVTGTTGYAQDTRVPAGNHPVAPAVGRLIYEDGLPHCTGWITKGGLLITAGHCKKNPDHDISNAVKIEFNVPLSDNNGATNPADEEDQYTISSWVDWNDGDKDNDWAIFRVEDNAVTGLQPIEAQLVYIDLQQDLTGTNCRTLGYGVDFSPAGSGGLYNNKNKTLQMDVGANATASPTSNVVKCMTYGRPGGSGGPIIDENTNKAIGIVHTSNYNPNNQEGTSTRRSSFWNTFQGEQTSFTLTVTQ